MIETYARRFERRPVGLSARDDQYAICNGRIVGTVPVMADRWRFAGHDGKCMKVFHHKLSC